MQPYQTQLFGMSMFLIGCIFVGTAPAALLMLRLMYGIDILASRPVAEIGRIAPRPVLITHTPRDQYIPLAEARRNEAAVVSAELWVAGGSEHARNYNADPEEYVRRVTGFFDRGLKT